jgi:energy-coupling factor transporter ATP-binding protein EcfA2
MITLLTGKKGSGKTKKLIELANTAVANSKGNVVVIEKGQKLTYDISHEARLIDVDSYGINGVDALYGFISGICAGNYDVTNIFIDSTLKITDTGAEGIESLIKALKKISNEADTDIVLSVSAADEDIPESLSEFMENK